MIENGKKDHRGLFLDNLQIKIITSTKKSEIEIIGLFNPIR